MGSGGPNGGPQYSPFSVSGTGGNGQSGMNTDYTGFEYGMNKQINEQREAEPLAKDTTAVKPTRAEQMNFQVRDLYSDTMNDAEPMTNGVDVGPGAGSQALPMAFQNNQRKLENIEVVKKYMPSLIMGAKMPGAPDSYKQFISYLEGVIWE